MKMKKKNEPKRGLTEVGFVWTVVGPELVRKVQSNPTSVEPPLDAARKVAMPYEGRKEVVWAT